MMVENVISCYMDGILIQICCFDDVGKRYDHTRLHAILDEIPVPDDNDLEEARQKALARIRTARLENHGRCVQEDCTRRNRLDHNLCHVCPLLQLRCNEILHDFLERYISAIHNSICDNHNGGIMPPLGWHLPRDIRSGEIHFVGTDGLHVIFWASEEGNCNIASACFEDNLPSTDNQLDALAYILGHNYLAENQRKRRRYEATIAKVERKFLMRRL